MEFFKVTYGRFAGVSDYCANPSLKRSANRRPSGRVWRYTVHLRQAVLGALPPSSAWLARWPQ
jgi:hypothetical protein